MAVSHVFSSPVADFTGTVTVFDSNGNTATTNATALVRPSNWNSVHNQFMTISGNTSGASTASGTNLVFQGGNNVTLSVTDQTIIFSASQSQSVQTQNMVSVLGSTGNISFANGNGVTFGGNASTITASHNGLTSQSNQAFSAPGGSSAFQTLVFANSQGVSWSNSNGSVVASVATNYAASDHSHGNPTLALTNLSGTTASNSAGLTLSLSAANPGGGAAFSAGISGGNTSGDTGTVSNQIVFAGGNNITVSGSTNAGGMSVTISGANAGGAQTGISGIQVSNTTYTSGTVTFQNANGISFGSSGANGVSASYTVPTVTNSSWTVSDAATSATVGRLAFTNSNGLTLSLSTSNNGNHTVIGSYTVPTITSWTVSDSATSATVGRLAFTASNGLTLTLSTSNNGNHTVIGSYTRPVVSNAIQSVGSATGSGTNTSRFAADDHVHAGVFSMGVSTGGNTAGDTRVDVGQFVLAGGANITLSQATAANGLNTVSIVGGAGGGGGAAISAAGASASNGTVVFSNSNNVSFGMNGSTVTATITVPAQSNQTGGIYFTAQTTGQSSSSTYDLRTLSVVGDGIVSAGWSNGTVRISATQSNQAFSADASSTFQTLTFQNSNGISFSNNGGALRITHGLAGTATAITGGASMTVNSGGISFNGTALAGTGTTFAGANISASMTMNSNGLNLSASVAAPGAAAENNNINLLGANTAGNTTASGSTIGLSGINMTLSGTNNSQIVMSVPATSSLVGVYPLSISTNGSTISVLAQTESGYNPYADYGLIIAQPGQATLQIDPEQLPNVQFDRVLFGINNTNSSNSSGSHTLSFWIGIYTKNASSLSRVSSTSTSFAVTHSGTAGSYSLLSGMRLVSIPMTSTLTAGNYWLGFVSRTTSGGANGSYSNVMGSNVNTNFVGFFNSAHNTTMQMTLGQGVYSATTSGMPQSIAFSEIRGSDSMALRPVIMMFASGTI